MYAASRSSGALSRMEKLWYGAPGLRLCPAYPAAARDGAPERRWPGGSAGGVGPAGRATMPVPFPISAVPFSSPFGDAPVRVVGIRFRIRRGRW
ncbi:hypothetical protein GCM10010166_59250 [Couchioplanes caeruleus subsp. azureus]|nr:hypothetical protein GCM10010166_59250 [Couchioplanes caeruleus subsp. azureus]